MPPASITRVQAGPPKTDSQLFGGSSPLPAFYSEQALGDSEDGNPTRNFLDLFHHRLQRLMLPIWRKYRYRASFQSGSSWKDSDGSCPCLPVR